jgi:hypothetical protein
LTIRRHVPQVVRIAKPQHTFGEMCGSAAVAKGDMVLEVVVAGHGT